MLHIQFGYALGCAHDIAGIDRLVGGNENKGANAVAHGGVGQPPRANDVVAKRLAHLVLQHGQMLVGGGVKNDFGPRATEQGFNRGRIAHVTQHGFYHQVAEFRLELVIDAVQVVFTAVQHDQAGRVEVGNLPAQLGAYGPATAGDKNALACEARAHGFPVTRLPVRPAAVVSRASLAGARPRRTSMATGLASSKRIRAGPSCLGLGTVRSSSPAVSQMPTSRCIWALVADGMAMPAMSISASRAMRGRLVISPSTGTPSTSPWRSLGSSSRKPTTSKLPRRRSSASNSRPE